MTHPPDMTCVPYRRKALYYLLTVPFLATLMVAAIYLWTISPWLTVALALCYLGASLAQAYCCAYQACPYIGRFCPAIGGIVPAGWSAKVLYGGRTITRSRVRFEIHATIGLLGLVGMALLPLWWITQRSLPLAMGYVVLQLAYYAAFMLTVCPVCAIRETCPGGTLQRMCSRREIG